jgi:diaminopimelate decarboxylase
MSRADSSPGFARRGPDLTCDGVSLSALAEQHGTPLFVYSAARIRSQLAAVRSAFAAVTHRVHYAVKANSNLSILQLLASEGAGFDIVSGGELERLDAAGVSAKDAVFAGVGKTEAEMRAALAADILLFNVESAGELELIEQVATAMGTVARVALRLNPDIDAGVHKHVTTGTGRNKFGVDLEEAARLVRRAQESTALDLCGYHVHLGSTLRSPEPYLASLDKLLEFLDQSLIHAGGIRYLDLGGGFGVPYRPDDPDLDLPALGSAVAERLEGRNLTVLLEPGRFLVAEAGCLLTRVQFVKRSRARRYAVVDAGMSELIRPCLYDAWHAIEPVATREGSPQEFDVVGPICESGDFLGLGRPLVAPQRGDLLAVLAAGAYGSSMSSNYNSRGRAAEVLVDGTRATIIRRREPIADLWRLELP